jgi:hypothetical protein
VDFFVFVALAFVILAVCTAMIYSYTQQSRRLQAIQVQLSKIEDNKPDILRQERAQWLDPLVMLEVNLNQSPNPQLDEAMLQQIDAARDAIKSLNERLMSTREWMGPPFDLEWTEYLERMPTLKKLYIALSYSLEDATTASAQIVKE